MWKAFNDYFIEYFTTSRDLLLHFNRQETNYPPNPPNTVLILTTLADAEFTLWQHAVGLTVCPIKALEGTGITPSKNIVVNALALFTLVLQLNFSHMFWDVSVEILFILCAFDSRKYSDLVSLRPVRRRAWILDIIFIVVVTTNRPEFGPEYDLNAMLPTDTVVHRKLKWKSSLFVGHPSCRTVYYYRPTERKIRRYRFRTDITCGVVSVI